METEDTFIPEDMHLAVKYGAAWLDEHDPNWVSKIHLETLQMDHGGQCILGQTQGDYWEVLGDRERGDLWAYEHGFDVPNLPDADRMSYDEYVKQLGGEYAKLQATWTTYIEKEREDQE